MQSSNHSRAAPQVRRFLVRRGIAGLVALSLGAACASVPAAQPASPSSCSAGSPAHTVALLELYTSEGCSSCPPADKFVANLRRSGFTEEQVVPLALHVDYWDGIGWKDRFAQPLFSARQRQLAASAAQRAVYTPEIFVSGREVRGWADAGQGGVGAAVRRINAQPARADIRLRLENGAQAGQVTAQVEARAEQEGRLYVALYESGLSSAVKAGENRGATLMHDYVVRDWIGPLAVHAGVQPQAVALPRSLMLPAGAMRRYAGVAAFVQAGNGEILPALAMPLCGN